MKKFKMGKLGRRQFTLIVLVLLIAITGYINVSYEPDAVPVSKIENTEETASEVSVEKNDYFAMSRLDREKAREDAIELYREIVNDTKSSEQAKADAEKNIAQSAKAKETETVLENLIKAKGFSDVVVYILNDSVTAVVKTSGLVPSQAAQIKDLIVEYTKVDVQNIKITEIK